jgi:hypothetical protein
MRFRATLLYQFLAVLGVLLLAGIVLGAGPAAAKPGNHGNGHPGGPPPGQANGHGNGHGNGNGNGNGQAKHDGDQDANAPGTQSGAPVVWTPRVVTATLAPGASQDVTATFTVTRALTNVRVRLVPPRGTAVTVTPSTFASLQPGQTYTVHLHLQVPAGAHRGAYNTVLQLRAGQRTVPAPLSVHIRVARP